jgi:hypothetical protein
MKSGTSYGSLKRGVDLQHERGSGCTKKTELTNLHCSKIQVLLIDEGSGCEFGYAIDRIGYIEFPSI